MQHEPVNCIDCGTPVAYDDGVTVEVNGDGTSAGVEHECDTYGDGRPS
ncbi:hypothetical protein [Micromonospora sp. WMMC273]|nr:hypothetical protein [Micromonospora sp. WMMC273]MCZ7478897.1 hypothetical protein [Micromonospora sp. WMMC273]